MKDNEELKEVFTPEELKELEELNEEEERLTEKIEADQNKPYIPQKGGGRPKVQRVVFPLKRKRGRQRKIPKPVGRPPKLIKIYDSQTIVKKFFIESQKRDLIQIGLFERLTENIKRFNEWATFFQDENDLLWDEIKKLKKKEAVQAIADKNILLLFDMISLDIKTRGYCDMTDGELRAFLTRNGGDLLMVSQITVLVNKLIEDRKFTSELYYFQDGNNQTRMGRKLHQYLEA